MASSPSPSSLSSRAAALRSQRESLPIWKIRHELLRALETAPTLVLTGETGSGKSTQVPQLLRSAGYSEVGAIAVTQPRRVAATSIARRVAEEAGVPLGGAVGYSVRFDERFDRRKVGRGGTQIKYLTDGMLLREVSRRAQTKGARSLEHGSWHAIALLDTIARRV